MMNVPGLNHGATDTRHGFGEYYGQQQSAGWGVGDTSQQTLVSAEPAEALWRVSVFGDVVLRVTWGTVSTFTLEGVLAPLVAYFPGRITVTATPRDAALGANAFAILTRASSGQLPVFRTIQSAAGPLPFAAWRVTALTAATVTVSGVAVVLAPGDSLPVIDDSSLTAGTVLVELAP